MAQINAYIGFKGQCREAMTFYQQCLGGELMFQPIGGSPMESQFPAGLEDQILHCSLTNGGLLLMATDCVGPGGYIKGNNVALSLNCSSEEEIRTFYSKLSAGGEIMDALKEQFWGAMFGVFTDKFGIVWMLHFDKNQK